MVVVEVQGTPVPQGSMSAIPFHRPCPRCKREGDRVVKACDRPRICVAGRELGANVVHGNAKELAEWRDTIAAATAKALDDIGRMVAWARERPCVPAGSVTLGVHLVAERPQGHWTARGALSSDGEAHPEPWRKPDVDKMLRAVLDALTGLVYKDDAQVATVIAAKDWAPRGGGDRAVVIFAPGRSLLPVAEALDRRLLRPLTGELFGGAFR